MADQSREWLYVTDWAAACITALHHGEPGDVFNIGDGTELTNLELARSDLPRWRAPTSRW